MGSFCRRLCCRPFPAIAANSTPGREVRSTSRIPAAFWKKAPCSAWSARPLPLEAFVVVDLSDVNLVDEGEKVRLQVDEAPGHVLAGTIVELANLDLKVVPRELAKGSELPLQSR